MIRKIIFAAAITLTCYTTQAKSIRSQNKEIASKQPEIKNFEQIVREAQFKFEEYFVTTEDGYILSLWRIPGSINETQSTVKKPPVLFLPGLMAASYNWVDNRPEVAPAFVAARAGYDVWCGNNRGVATSQGHTMMDAEKDKEYWEFSWQEMGEYDLPSFIEFIQSETGGQKVAVVGYSQSTTFLFSAFSEKPEYFKDRVSIAVALGPITKMTKTQSQAMVFAANYYSLHLDRYVYDIIHGSEEYCQKHVFNCKIIETAFVPGDSQLNDDERLALAMGHYPSGKPGNCLDHYIQNIKEDRFQAYAPYYSAFWNIEKNNQTKLFPLQDIRVPMAIFTGIQDGTATLEDSRWTRDQILQSLVHYEEIQADHATFSVGKDMSFFSEGVIGLFKEYHPTQADEEKLDLLH